MDQILPLGPSVADAPRAGGGAEGMSRTLSGRTPGKAPAKATVMKRRFRAISNRLFQPSRPFAFYRWLTSMTLATFAIAYFVSLTITFKSPEMAARHLAAMPNCAAAAAVGLARPHIGQPGYWPWLDEDEDGNACEPYLKAS